MDFITYFYVGCWADHPHGLYSGHLLKRCLRNVQTHSAMLSMLNKCSSIIKPLILLKGLQDNTLINNEMPEQQTIICFGIVDPTIVKENVQSTTKIDKLYPKIGDAHNH